MLYMQDGCVKLDKIPTKNISIEHARRLIGARAQGLGNFYDISNPQEEDGNVFIDLRCSEIIPNQNLIEINLKKENGEIVGVDANAYQSPYYQTPPPPPPPSPAAPPAPAAPDISEIIERVMNTDGTVGNMLLHSIPRISNKNKWGIVVVKEDFNTIHNKEGNVDVTKKTPIFYTDNNTVYYKDERNDMIMVYMDSKSGNLYYVDSHGKSTWDEPDSTTYSLYKLGTIVVNGYLRNIDFPWNNTVRIDICDEPTNISSLASATSTSGEFSNHISNLSDTEKEKIITLLSKEDEKTKKKINTSINNLYSDKLTIINKMCDELRREYVKPVLNNIDVVLKKLCANSGRSL